MDNLIAIYILLVLNIISFLLGYLYGNRTVSGIEYSNTKSNKQKTLVSTNNNIEIDDKKVVLNIDTKGLEKKYEDLGDKQVSENNITSSISKLKNLKG